ncbi:hypothetical protein [Campylobacter hyointestinalis]|uniref:hypothetical protein n=1 Tax=Campylobacter hyointestinalis TaxID=198 RepID=UPI002552B05E|nr:hypothetical protein [Campylobacter hyointestinalis]MDL2348519.1 hypothetical protein [Campylobacter hyointestinalis]MDL2350356.1 hypothetical protein [Campylobacter hyointestinalis]MDM1026095.1 hypothetical protein [Campylobacter hyointestinalis]MDM1027270.1 hypothetical protein [Campylobacter hyointestinalis]
MKAKKQCIISIDQSRQSAYSFSQNIGLSLKSLSNIQKNDGYFISYIKHKDLIIAPIDVSLAGYTPTSPEEIEGVITQKAYEELALDQNFEYKINYIKQEDSATIYDTFIANTQAIYENYKEILKNIKYIDCITAAPLLMQVLYKNNILRKDGVDCFIYLQEDDAFLVVYKYGEYLQSKSLSRYSLGAINTRLCELSGNKLSYEDFAKQLRINGLNLEDAGYLSQILDDAFYYVSDIISSIQNFSNLSINNIYISSDLGNIDGLDKFVQDRILIKTQAFDFNINLKNKELDHSYLHTFMTLYAMNCIKGDLQSINFSNFLRPPAFYKRNGGIFLSIVCASLVASLAYPCYQFLYGYCVNIQASYEQEKINDRKSEIQVLQTKLDQINLDIQATKQNIYLNDKNLNLKKNLLSQIYNKKVNYPMKGVAIYDIAGYTKDMDIKIRELSIKDRNISLSVNSSSDKQITQFMQDLERSKIYKIRTKEIFLLSNPNLGYESNITVEIKQ